MKQIKAIRALSWAVAICLFALLLLRFINAGLFAVLSFPLIIVLLCASAALLILLRRLDKEREDIFSFIENWEWDGKIPDEGGEFTDLFVEKMLENTRKSSMVLLDKQAQIRALQGQINPHFLYNTLEAIRGQALEYENIEIAQMAEALGKFFRYSISQKEYIVTMRDELHNVENYFKIQKYRFDDKFQMHIEFDPGSQNLDVQNYFLPKLTLQPIVENCIYHGLEAKGERGSVFIRIKTTRERLIITISDDGVGMSAKDLDALNEKLSDRSESTGSKDPAKGEGVALVNVNKRIRLLYGADYGLHVYSTIGYGTDIEITLPLRENNQPNSERLEND